MSALVRCPGCGTEVTRACIRDGRCEWCPPLMNDLIASTPVWVRSDITHARRARARLRRCRAIERQYGDQLTDAALAMVRHVAFSCWLECRELGFPVDVAGEALGLNALRVTR